MTTSSRIANMLVGVSVGLLWHYGKQDLALMAMTIVILNTIEMK